MKIDRKWTLGAGAIVASLALGGAAWADEGAARDIVKKMTDYLASQQTLSFDFDSNLQVVTTDGEKLDIASSGSLSAARPDRLHELRRGGFASIEEFFDGKTLTVINHDTNTWAQVDAAGSIDDLILNLRDNMGRPVPAADLLAADGGASLMADVVEAKDLGSGVIRGEECDHLAFRTEEVDWQIWVAQGDVPHPCRFAITSKKVEGSPSYTLEFSNWGKGAASAEFGFTAPDGATQAEIKDIPNLDDLAGIFMVKGAN